MKKFIISILALVIFISFVIDVFAQTLNSEVAKLADLYGVRAYSVTYVDNGTFTTFDNNNGESLVFEAGSLSKTVVAYICMSLVNEGKLSLDDPITQYIDEKWITSDIRFNNINIRELLSHTAGFSSSYEMIVDKKLYFEPGKYFSYSGVGYIYLQQVIENVTGETLEQSAQQYIFQPLNMQNSTFSGTSTVTPYVNTSSLVLYIIAVWSIVSLIIFILGLIVGLITKFKSYNKKILFYDVGVKSPI